MFPPFFSLLSPLLPPHSALVDSHSTVSFQVLVFVCFIAKLFSFLIDYIHIYFLHFCVPQGSFFNLILPDSG